MAEFTAGPQNESESKSEKEGILKDCIYGILKRGILAGRILSLPGFFSFCCRMAILFLESWKALLFPGGTILFLES